MSDFKQYPPVRLPKVSLANVRLFNSVSLRGASWNVPFGQGWAEVRLKHASQGFPAQCRADVLVDGLPWEIAFTNAAFIRFHPVLAECGADPENLPGELRAAVAEELLTPVAEGLQAALGVPVVIEQVEFGTGLAQQAEPAAASLLFAVEIAAGPDSAGESMLVSVAPHHPADAAKLTDILARLPHRTDGPFARVAGGIPVGIAVSAGETRLLIEEFGALSLGDIVLVNEWLPANGRAELGVYLRNRKLLAAPCSLAEQTVQVLE